MQVLTADVAPCLTLNAGKAHGLILCEPKQRVIAFAQNTREEVRILGEDGNVAGCVSAESGSHQTTYLCISGKKNRLKNVPHGTTDGKLLKGAFFRNGSFGIFVPTETSGTLETLHMACIGNDTPCICVEKRRRRHVDRDTEVSHS